MSNIVKFKWNLISPIEGKSICEVVGAKKVIEYPDILNEIVNNVLNREGGVSFWLDEEYLRKFYQSAWYCTDCKLYGILFPEECGISITQMDYSGSTCEIDEVILVADLLETHGAHLIEECMKDRSPEEMLELASLLKEHVQRASERFKGDKDVEWFISNLEYVINWLIALANYGFSISTTIIGS